LGGWGGQLDEKRLSLKRGEKGFSATGGKEGRERRDKKKKGRPER